MKLLLKNYRLSGAGNTFNITQIDKDTEFPSSQKDIAVKLCKDFPADGFIFLKEVNASENLFTWDFFNNDGSVAEMCGNAARCVGFFLSNIQQIQRQPVLLKTKAGIVIIRETKNNILTPSPNEKFFDVQMTSLKRLPHKEFFYCDTGVPHVVIPISNINRYSLMKDFCSEIRTHADFAPRGTNVTLIDTTNIEKLSAVTFERGVEGFTQACGTGAVAAAYYVWEKMGRASSKIHMPGGALLINLENLSQPVMTGPVLTLGEFNYEI